MINSQKNSTKDSRSSPKMELKKYIKTIFKPAAVKRAKAMKKAKCARTNSKEETQKTLLKNLEKSLGYSFKDEAILREALTHPVSVGFEKKVKSNQRLEFLGDAVLQAVITDIVFRKFGDIDEGKLTKIRIALTQGTFLAEISKSLGIPQCLIVPKGAEEIRQSTSASEDAFEAVIGAIYLDSNFERAKKVVLSWYKRRLEDLPDLGPSIIMEYIEGCTLSEWLSTNPPQNERRRVFEELLTAVNYLHQRGIIHNDLKPDNILISRADNTLKLIDFGLADSDAHIALRRLGCTPKYASPELQARGEVDARSDIYSIGVIMGELFGGRHKRIAERCTKQHPQERYTNIAALQHAWQGRNRCIRLVATILLITMVLPSVVEHIASVGKERKREALMEEIKSEVENRYMLSADSIKMAHYKEFAAMIISHFYYDMWLYHTTKLPQIEPVELREEATNHYTLIVNPLNQQLWEDVTALPSVHNSNLPQEELDYYLELLRLGKPYKSYSE